MASSLQSKESYIEQLENKGLGRIALHITKYWPTDDLCEYFTELLIDKRNTGRGGFDDETYIAILKLYTIYCFDKEKIDKWADTFFK